MSVPILKQGDVLIASIQSALSDQDLIQLRDDFSDKIGRLHLAEALSYRALAEDVRQMA